MASLEQLSRLGKQVMNASVDAQLLGLEAIASYLGMAFDEIVRESVALREQLVLEEAELELAGSGEDVVAC